MPALQEGGYGAAYFTVASVGWRLIISDLDQQSQVMLSA
jgi:hypothetical protein